MGQQDNGKDENSLKDLMKYFSTDEKKVSSKEFQEFWNSLSEEEKSEFKRAELK